MGPVWEFHIHLRNNGKSLKVFSLGEVKMWYIRTLKKSLALSNGQWIGLDGDRMNPRRPEGAALAGHQASAHY